jgi:uncharacterized protein (DUF1499 family)
VRAVLWIVAALAVLGAGFALYVHAAPSELERWHVDPLAAPGTGRPNQYRVGPAGIGDVDATTPVYRVPPRELAHAVDALAMALPRATRLAGGPDGLWTTYVHRSRLMGFPDYTSVRVTETDDGATLGIFGRARFGGSDLGVNRARVEKWLEALAPMAQEPGSETPAP